MKVIDKNGYVMMEVSRPTATCARIGTARALRSEDRRRKPYKVVSKEDFDAGLY